MNERAHAILSPSFLHVSLQCAAAVGLKESLPPEAPGAPAIKGTKLHLAGSWHLDNFLHKKITGEEIPRPAEVDTDPETAKVADAWTQEIWHKAFDKSVTGKVYGIEDKLIFSEKYSLWGTTDFWLVSTDERAKPYGMVCDLKTGFILVDAAANPQLAAYALSLRKTVRDAGKDLDYVRAAIFQPFGDGDKWKETKFTSKQLDVWEKKFLKLAEAVFSNQAKFKAGEHCSYCPGRVVCKVYDKYRVKETGLKLLDPEEFKFPEAPSAPVDALVRIVKHEKQLESFVAACRKELLNRMLRGDKVPGMKLVQSKTRRKWDDQKYGELDSILAKHTLCLFENTPKGVTEIREALGLNLKKKEVEELLKPFLVTPPGGITLAAESDKRDEVKPAHGLFLDEPE